MNKWLIWARVMTLFVFLAPFVFALVYIGYVIWQLIFGTNDLTGT